MEDTAEEGSGVEATLTHECSEVLPLLLTLVEEIADRAHEAPAAVSDETDSPLLPALLLSALQALHALMWSVPSSVLPRVRSWLQLRESRPAVFSELLSPSMAEEVRVCTMEVLILILRDAPAFIAFTTATPPREQSKEKESRPQHAQRAADVPTVAKPAALVALALASIPSAVPRPKKDFEKPKPSWYLPSTTTPSIFGPPVYEKKSTLTEDELDPDAPGEGKGSLRHSALSVLSSLVATHEHASERLLEPALGLALPERLIALMQSQVHALLQYGHEAATRAQIDTVQICVFLLLELSRAETNGTSTMSLDIDGGRWPADLRGATQLLVELKVHPLLADMVMPAKLLQNAIASAK